MLHQLGYININHKDNPLKIGPLPEDQKLIILPVHEQMFRPMLVSFAARWLETPLAEKHDCKVETLYLQHTLGEQWPYVLDALAKRYYMTASYDPVADIFRIEQWRN